MQLLHEQRSQCVLTVKKNLPTLYADLAAYFADPQASCQRAETWDRSLRRGVHCVIRVSTELNAYLAPDWPLGAQVAEVTRTVTTKGVTSTEVVYLITDLSPQQASPLRLLTLVRVPWGIENRSHYEGVDQTEKLAHGVKLSLASRSSCCAPLHNIRNGIVCYLPPKLLQFFLNYISYIITLSIFKP